MKTENFPKIPKNKEDAMRKYEIEDIGKLTGFEATLQPIENCAVSEERLQKIAKALIGTEFTDENKQVLGTITEARLTDAAKAIFKVVGKIN